MQKTYMRLNRQISHASCFPQTHSPSSLCSALFSKEDRVSLHLPDSQKLVSHWACFIGYWKENPRYSLDSFSQKHLKQSCFQSPAKCPFLQGSHFHHMASAPPLIFPRALQVMVDSCRYLSWCCSTSLSCSFKLL